MASKKAQMLEESVRSDLHPFAARMSTPPPADSSSAPGSQEITPPPASDASVPSQQLPTEQPIDPLTRQPASQPISQSTDLSIYQSTGGSRQILDRPKAFYITARLDGRLNQAVRYYQEQHGMKKVDRSAIVNAMLDTNENWTDEALDRLARRVMDQLTSRLVD